MGFEVFYWSLGVTGLNGDGTFCLNILIGNFIWQKY